MKINLGNQTITRVYKCDNEECEAEVACVELVSDKWKKRCPFCGKKKLYLDRAALTLSTLMGTKEAKTLGSVSDSNWRRREKEHGPEPKKKKVNFDILKNPKKYIETGKV